MERHQYVDRTMAAVEQGPGFVRLTPPVQAVEGEHQGGMSNSLRLQACVPHYEPQGRLLPTAFARDQQGQPLRPSFHLSSVEARRLGLVDIVKEMNA